MSRSGIKVRIVPDRMGGWHIKPVSAPINEAIVAHLAKFNEKGDGVYLQIDRERNEFAEIFGLCKKTLKDLDNGWPVSVNVDAYYFLQSVIGYDAGDLNILKGVKK